MAGTATVNRESGAFEWFASLLYVPSRCAHRSSLISIFVKSKDIEQSLTADVVHINTYITAEMKEEQIHNVTLNDIGGKSD